MLRRDVVIFQLNIAGNTPVPCETGVLPIALALAAAAQSRVSMGIVIIGGLLFSLGLTLFLIPALYTYLSSKGQRVELETMPEFVKKSA